MAKKYKMKTHSGAKARFYVTGNGKFLRRKIGINNFRRKKHRRTKGQFDEMMEVHPSVRRRMRRLLPYGR